MSFNESKILCKYGIRDRKTFLKWALRNHPDKGGDLQMFQTVQSEYTRVSALPIPPKPQKATAGKAAPAHPGFFTHQSNRPSKPASSAGRWTGFPQPSSAPTPDFNPFAEFFSQRPSNSGRPNPTHDFFTPPRPAGRTSIFTEFFTGTTTAATAPTNIDRCSCPTTKCWRERYGDSHLCDLHQPNQPCESAQMAIYGKDIFDITGLIHCPPYKPTDCDEILENGHRCRNRKKLPGKFCYRHT